MMLTSEYNYRDDTRTRVGTVLTGIGVTRTACNAVEGVSFQA